jgi:DNA-binding HxlR family transcriptional regulator
VTRDRAEVGELARLRELEAAGVLARLPLRHNTRAYALTDRGHDLRDAIVALGRWGDTT